MQSLYNIEQKLVHSFWLLPPDVYERQCWIKNHLPKHQNILDLGGEERHLEKLTQAKHFVTLNVDSTVAHNEISLKDKVVYYDGNNIPFQENSFDYVVCIDVLEHVPQDKRLHLISQMVNIAKKKVIISAPYGSGEHIEYEKKLYKKLRLQKLNVHFLEEHISIGLPKPEEIEDWIKKHPGTIQLSGNYKFSGWLLRFSVINSHNPIINHCIFFSRLVTNLIINLIGYKVINTLTSKQSKNRFYLVINE